MIQSLSQTPAGFTPVGPAGPALGVGAGEGEAPAPTPRVAGIDLSLTATGIAVPDGCTSIRTVGHKGDSLTARGARLRSIRRQILDWTGHVDLVVIEAPSFASQHGSMHDRSGLWWLVVTALQHRDIPVAQVAPTQRAKYATGNGRAGKDEVIAAVTRRFPMFDVRTNDEADAVTLLAMGLDHLGQPLAVLSDAQRAVLGKVTWPELVSA